MNTAAVRALSLASYSNFFFQKALLLFIYMTPPIGYVSKRLSSKTAGNVTQLLLVDQVFRYYEPRHG